MIRSSVTISLVSEARGGPFIFWDDLAAGCREAKQLGFDAVEVFAAPTLDPAALKHALDGNSLKLAAMGTGAGWVLHRLTLTSPDAAVRNKAADYIRSMIDLAGPFGAPAIIGSMQGRHGEGIEEPKAMGLLAEALGPLAEHASKYGVPLLFEPLNRYETNLVRTVADGVWLRAKAGSQNVKLLIDLFHTNIEEADVPAAIRAGAGAIGHVHFVDSNRRPAGCGHTDFTPIAATLREIGYDGYVSAEALPYPNPVEAASLTIRAYRKHFAGQ
ncbi:MAG TPA: sugar phosphate isomerase/epimerase family protein [Gemmataceae bacterium]|nr:sugar phosphate isomerase/epimerase family protein [Gemmataceae bacterium]